MPRKTATQRDVTRILALANAILKYAHTVEGSPLITGDTNRVIEIRDIAQKIDARTGRRDPSVRKAGKKPRA